VERFTSGVERLKAATHTGELVGNYSSQLVRNPSFQLVSN